MEPRRDEGDGGQDDDAGNETKVHKGLRDSESADADLGLHHEDRAADPSQLGTSASVLVRDLSDLQS